MMIRIEKNRKKLGSAFGHYKPSIIEFCQWEGVQEH